MPEIILPQRGDTITEEHETLMQRSSAVYSECMGYRYLLSRSWRESDARVAFVMLNPSTATEVQNDPTVERCERRAEAMGFGGYLILNLFAWRSTDPGALARVADPVGKLNNYYLAWALGRAEMVICAWGSDPAVMRRREMVDGLRLERWQEFVELARQEKAEDKLHALVRNADGMPRHPLYVGYDVQPVRWRVE